MPTNLCPTCYTPLERRDYPYIDPTALSTGSTGTLIARASFKVARLLVCPCCQKVIERLDGQASPAQEELSEEEVEQLLADLLNYDEDSDEDDEQDDEDSDADSQPIEAEQYTRLLPPQLTSPVPPGGDIQRHPGHPDQRVHGKWTKTDPHDKPLPASSKSSSSTKTASSGGKGSHTSSESGAGSTSSGTTSKKGRKKGPKLTKMERLETSMQKKMQQYEKLAHRKLSKKWTAADQQMAQKIANDLQSVLKALKSGHAAGMALVKTLLADAEKVHDAAPKSMSAHRIAALSHLMARMSKIAGVSRAADVPLLKWVAKCPCPTCQSNANSVALSGEAFPSGVTSVPCHDGCNCVLEEVQGDALPF